MEFQERYYGSQDDLLSVVENEDLDYKAIEFGLALHYTLEMMETFEEEKIELAVSSTQNRYGAVLEEREFTDIKNRIARLIQNTPFQELCLGKIYKEKAISFEQKLRYIDLLIEKEDSWIIIDYKSAMRHTSSHLKQVDFYKKAISKITGQKVSAYIAYLLEDDIKLIEV